MALQSTPLIGWAPDLDPRTPGVFSYCYGMEATVRGWRLKRSCAALTSTTPAAVASGFYMLDGFVSNTTTNNLEVIHLAYYDSTANKVKLLSYKTATGLIAASRAAFYGAPSATFPNVTFCQYGDITLATNLQDVVQTRDATTTNVFADSAAPGIPKAAICVTWGPPTSPRVMLLNYNDGTYYPDGWWSSHQGGPTLTWVPDVANGSANGRLLGAGPIRCAVAFRDTVIAFSDTQMWAGSFEGPPLVVKFQRISDQTGCIGPYAAKVIGGVLYFLGKQGLYMYDGSYPRLVEVPIQQEVGVLVRASIAGGVNQTYAQLTVDDSGQRLLAGTRAPTTPTPWDRVWSINLLNNKVGLLANGIGQQILNNNGRVSQLLLDRRYSASIFPDPAVGLITIDFESTNPFGAALGGLYGFGLSYLGDDGYDTTIKRVAPRFVSPPSTFQAIDYYGPSMSEALSNTNSSAAVVTTTPWRAFLAQSARWHAPRLYFSSNGTSAADPEVIDVAVDTVTPSGQS